MRLKTGHELINERSNPCPCDYKDKREYPQRVAPVTGGVEGHTNSQ